MIKLHHAPHSRSVRVRWLLEELALPYELVTKEFTPAVLRSEAHRRLHPLGQVPVIEDGQLVLFESGAILQHILERHGDRGLLPPQGSDARSLCWQWFHFGEAALARHISEVLRNRITKPEPDRIEAMASEARTRFRECLAVLESTLADDRAYIVGPDFTAADIMVGYALILARMIKELPDTYPATIAYVHRLRARPAYTKASA
jgi:glutathione S-transferase